MMNEERIHRTRSEDGTELVGRVSGQGPPLVLVPAGPGDSETTWRFVIPRLRERFTCHAMNTLRWGLSSDHPKHSPDRLVADITAYVESIGDPVGLISGGNVEWPLTANDGSAVAAIAAWEPIFDKLLSEADAALLADVFGRVGALAAEQRLEDAARAWLEGMAAAGFYTPEDVVDGAAPAFWQAAVSNIPLFVRQEALAARAEGPGPADPSVLAQVAAPVLLLHGSRTHPAFVGMVRHVAAHVAHPQVREIAGAGHFGIYTEPTAVTDELVPFFAAHLARA